MVVNDLKEYKKRFKEEHLVYHTDIFTKFIWGDMGEDTASINIKIVNDTWNLKYIRTESGEPYFGSGFICNIIDQYEKELDDDMMMNYLLDRGLCDEFEAFITYDKKNA